MTSIREKIPVYEGNGSSIAFKAIPSRTPEHDIGRGNCKVDYANSYHTHRQRNHDRVNSRSR